MPDGALQRAVDLLAALAACAPEAGPSVARLADATGTPTSTAYRLLAELQQHGLIVRGPDGSIALGTRLVALGRAAEAGLRERLVAPAEPVMARLAAATGETVLLTVPCALEALVLHSVDAERHSVRLSYAALRRAPIHRGASGKVLAAYLDEGDRQRLLTAVAAPGLAAELAAVRQAGYARTAGELDAGAAAVAAPIRDRRGRLQAGLSVAGPESRISAGGDALVGLVRDGAAAIERAIGG